MSKKEINDDQVAICFKELCAPNDISNMCYRNQLEAFHLSICFKV